LAEFFIWKWLFAFSPIATVLILMVGFNWGGGRAGAAGWFTAVIASVLFFGATPNLLAYAQMKGILLSLNVLYIIWMALLLYHTVNETGAVQAIGAGIERFSQDKTIQLLIFGWVFAAFLQGVAGYGVPIAVVAPLLAALNFNPVVAVAVPAVGHCWSVTFGSMGASFQAMMAVTGLSAEYLAHWSAVMLGISGYLCAVAAVHIYGGWGMVRHSALAIAIIGTVMASTQYALAVSGLWTLGGFGASLTGLIACVVVARLGPYRNKGEVPRATNGSEMSFGWALSAYGLLILIVSMGVLVPPIKQFLGQIMLSLHFPELISNTGWVVPAGSGQKIKIFGHGGALLGYSAVAAYLLYASRGYYVSGAVRTILRKTVDSGVPTSLGIVTMVCFALVMDQCGMTYLLAEGVSRMFGSTYPFFASWIGLLGAFMTGSNTNSNVVFGVLQQQTAELAGISAAVILAAQTTGGALGSMIAPAKIIVGCSTVGLNGQEAPVLRTTIKYGLIITTLIGVITLVVVMLGFK
jgi:lactate permease